MVKDGKKEYVIKEEDLEIIRGYVIGALQGEEPTKIEQLLESEYSYIRSRPLSEEIKRATDGVLNIISMYNNNDPIECPPKMKSRCDTFEGNCIDCVIKSLRCGDSQ